MECGFRQHRVAGQQRLIDAFGDVDRPGVVTVVPVPESDDESRVRNSLHRRVNPFREERSRGPLSLPAWRRKVRLPRAARAASSCWRTIRPAGNPVLRAVSSSQAASSSVRRIVIV